MSKKRITLIWHLKYAVKLDKSVSTYCQYDILQNWKKEENWRIEVEEQQKKLAFGIFVDLWICENWNILYEKWVNVLRLIPIPRGCIEKNQRNIVRRRRIKRKVMFEKTEKR